MKAERILGRRVLGPVGGSDGLPEHHIRCPACGTLLDMRRLGDVLEHEDACSQRESAAPH